MRILIVDDRALGVRKLRDEIHSIEPEYQVEVATGEGQAADHARQIVQGAKEPFDVFLIDDNLGVGLNGSELMAELRQLSPSSEAIIFTAYADEAGKRRAIEAGARAYVSRPVDEKELLWQLRGIEKDQSTRQERDWLHLLAKMTERLQTVSNAQDAGDAIVNGIRQLGFQRARLRMVVGGHGEQLELIGVSQMGNTGLQDDYTTTKCSLADLPYSRKVLIETQKPTLFYARELGNARWDEFMGPPKDEWFKVPLFVGQEPIGTLSLDNGADPCRYPAAERELLQQLLEQFGRQAAAALERVRRQEQEKRQAEEAKEAAQETELLNEISRQVTAVAAKGDLDELLDEVRRQVSHLKIDVTNFMVVLKDRETAYLDFRRQYEQDKLSQRHWRGAGEGLCGLVVTRNDARLIQDTESFCAKHGIRHYGSPAQCWLGIPLRVKREAIGVLAVQSYKDRDAYTNRHQQLLQKVADQVSGAIDMAYHLERKAELEQQDQALKALGKAMPLLIRESEDSFWHAVLTTITHQDGNSFNRAALFWYSQRGERMQGRMGIGYFTRADARRAWKEDLNNNRTLEQYFKAPHLARRRVTPLQQEIIDWRPETGQPDGPCYRIWHQATRQVISSTQLLSSLPTKLLQPPGLLDDATEYPCALVPVKAGDRVLGLLIVDNAFDGEPLRPRDLDKLENVLAEAMRVWLSHQEASRVQQLGESYEQIFALDHRLTAKAADRSLQESLQVLCQEAQTLTGADCVVIYPYQLGRASYDLNLVSHVGLKQESKFKEHTKAKPRQHGVTFSIVQSGTLVVPDVARSGLSFAGRELKEHQFLQREQIQAFIGLPLREPATSEPLGVIYFDYWMPQTFDELDIERAERIAAIGAKVITYHRAIERQEQGIAEAERSEQQRRREMQLLGNIQRQALAGDSDEKKVIHAILKNAAELFGRSAVVTLALLSWKAQGEHNRQMRHDWHLDKVERLKCRHPSVKKSLIGDVLWQNELYSTKNRLINPIRLGEKTIGALAIKKAGQSAAFDAIEQEVAERLTTVAAAALDNVRTRAYLQAVAQTVSAVADKKGLQGTLQVVVDKARTVASDIDCVTLWYEDQERKALVAGPNFGVLEPQHQGSNMQTNHLVRAVMDRRQPIFASVIDRGSVLYGDFVKDENIKSVAAFPLRFGEKPAAFGALFFNYRKNHEFTPLERTLFPIFADAAATAIHSAQTIELAERRGKRFETLLAASAAAGTTLDSDNVVRGFLQNLKDVFLQRIDENATPYFMYYDERERALKLHPVAHEFYSPDNPKYQGQVVLRLDDGQGITWRVARRALAEGRVIIENVPNVNEDQDYVKTNSRTKSELCAGLVSGRRLLGALVIKSDRENAFNAEDKKLFEMTAQQLALALDRLERIIEARRNASIAGAMAWAADIAHDINNDIGYIRNRAYWLREHQPPISEEGKTWAKEIDMRAKRLADSVRDARFRRQEPENFSLTELLHERVPTWAATRATDTEVHIEAADTFIISGDREQLWRAIRHLLRNARDAMGMAHSKQRRITLRLLPVDADYIELQIEDSGPGLNEKAQRRILREPYSDKDQEGRGYGLLIAQWLVESLGGRIYFSHPVSKCGACFSIRLPLKSQEVSYG